MKSNLMINLIYFLIPIFSFVLGYIANMIITKYKLNKEKKSKITKNESFYKELINNPNQIKFDKRINNTVYFDALLKNFDEIKLMYILDDKSIFLMKNSKSINNNYYVSDDLKERLSFLLHKMFNKDMFNTINIMGIIYSKDYFEKLFGIKAEDFMKLYNDISSNLLNGTPGSFGNNPSSNSRTILSNEDDSGNNNDELDVSKEKVDLILDKITKNGISSLNDIERRILEMYSNNN